ncbi:hypothetical protein J4Q44_G00057000 [Coregonus suidteri]|uniref:Uncharacterized protein n=1 Tax=Coregonus suidteri TaxID=861788 RepID=A0AAN8R3D7_9TELE
MLAPSEALDIRRLKAIVECIMRRGAKALGCLDMRPALDQSSSNRLQTRHQDA